MNCATGIFYNLALSVYYVLVINYGFRESDIKKLRAWFHLPSLAGLALAFAGIPYYDNFLWLCHIPPPPIGQSFLYNDGIALVPISAAIVLSAIAMFMVYIKVYCCKLEPQTGGGLEIVAAQAASWLARFSGKLSFLSWRCTAHSDISRILWQ